MAIYLTGSGSISPQPVWEKEGLESVVSYAGTRLNAVEPDYAAWIDPKLRRMSRVMLMGAAAALLALKNGGVKQPDAIITGTGFGCLQDTANFLTRVITNREEALNPTPFIQSTHNTISGQLALILQCHNYNVTYTNGPFSFEDALLDGMLFVNEQPGKHILVGGIDEITDASHEIQNRFGIFKKQATNSLDLFRSGTKGTLNGEGSSWFILTGRAATPSVRVDGVRTFHTPVLVEKSIADFLTLHGTRPEEIDFVLSGKSGNSATDAAIDAQIDRLFPASSTGVFKHLSGEYPTASAFALWVAASIVRSGTAHPAVVSRDRQRGVRKLLIYNQYFRDHHSLILLSRP